MQYHIALLLVYFLFYSSQIEYLEAQNTATTFLYIMKKNNLSINKQIKADNLKASNFNKIMNKNVI